MVPTNKYSRPQAEQAYSRSGIAREQLKTATHIFLKGIDYSSVITLAGAASNIFHQMVINAGKEPFNEYARRVCKSITGQMPARQSYTHRINQLFGINMHKHLSKDASEVVEIDLEKCARDALTRAMADYVKLYGDQEDFVRAFFQCMWVELDGPSIMKRFEEVPEHLKP
jgi:hypothetical protein